VQPDCIKFIELKGWQGAEHPFAAALQGFTYMSIASILSAMRRDSPNISWPQFSSIEVSVAASVAWFQDFERDGNVDSVLCCFGRAVSSIPHCLWAPYSLNMKFCGKGVKIKFEKAEFVALFSDVPVRDYRTVGETLNIESRERLLQCFLDAFN
jgi:hypothetical protein